MTSRTPADILRRDGEAAFRELETRVLRERVAPRTGAVIATGGGIVLRQENVDLLRQNGRIYLLDRPWQKLVPSGSRPLSATPELLRQRYEERRERYLSSADVRVTDPGTPEEAADRIRKDLEVI